MGDGRRHREGPDGGRLYLPHEVGTVLGPDGKPKSTGAARREARDRERERCGLPECRGPAEHKLPNGVEVCGPCYAERCST